MPRSSLGVTTALLILAAAPTGAATDATTAAPRSTRYEDLVSLFSDWRAFQKPKIVDGVPDYTPAAMAAQKRELAAYQRRLAAIDPSGWPIAQQADWHVVRAEMNGLDFDHRILQPWAKNPGFYVTVFSEESDQPAREGPFAWGAVELWTYKFPLTAADAAKVDAGVRTIPKLLAQAKSNLTGKGKDLWIYGTKNVRQQSAELAQLASTVAAAAGTLPADVARAREATDDFAAWLDSQAASKTEPSGVGVENYDWYLKNVQLVPYTWRDEVTIMERELARSHALLAMEEQRNANLPQPAPVASAAEYDRRFGEGVTEYMAFLKDHDVLEVKDWMDPALRARLGAYSAGPREFFGEVDYRDPELMRTHGYHWFDKARMVHEPHPSAIRRGALLYNIFNTRTEGHATGWEELMMQAGMFDARPRTRELLYILLAERAARALGDLRMTSNEFTLEQASEFASANTPRGWLSLKGNLVRGEQHLYLQQPGYGTSYIIGKIEIEKLLAERRQQLGEKFTMKHFMKEFDDAGLIPASLIRWELTGKKSPELEQMLR
jgi:uncharacterized protein (DUF885 family)